MDHFAFTLFPLALWYNLPTFSPCASWDPNATTFADQNTIGSYPHGIFVDTNNTVYAGSWGNDFVQVWRDGDSAPTRTISGGLYCLFSLFVTVNGDVYVDNGAANDRIDKWTSNETSSVNVMNVNASCHGLFIDTNNTLYCSLCESHQIVKGALTTGVITPTTVAGNGLPGSTSDMLCYPWGIFVDTDFTLYVADTNNHRIQRFQLGELNGTTVAGSAAPVSFELNYPTDVVLDADGYLFIMDSGNYRIVGSSSAGFRCLAGCSDASGSTSDKLFNARNMAFDTYGNIFVTDDDNHRIQQFFLASNSCAPSNVTYELEDYPPYKISNNKTDFDSAQASCQSMNMTLVEIASIKKQSQLMNITTFTQDLFYIGLERQCATSNYTQWLSGKLVTYTNWDTDQPSPCLSSRQCVIAGNSSGNSRWKTGSCSSALRFVCEPYVMFPYTLARSTFLGNNAVQTAYAIETNQQITLFEQIQVQSSTIADCVYQCFMNSNCITISFDQGECLLALN